MIFLPTRSEVLVTSPLYGRVLRYDAMTLEQRGVINTVFGVRTIAYDQRRDLLLAGSFLTNGLEVIDAKTNKPLRRYHLGPWLRAIALDLPRGVAFVSSYHGVYEVKYADAIAPAQPAR